jgi:hypothetical protein
VVALSTTCQELAQQSSLERFEIAVKGRIQSGIKDDNDLRNTDELLHQVVLNADAVLAATDPVVSELYVKHKAAVAEVKKWIYYNSTTKRWEGRWGVLREALASIMLKYKREKEDLARRQQAELDRAADDERRRKEAAAREALRNGDLATAKAAMQEAAEVVTPVIMNASPVLDNSKDRTVWVISITDPEALVKAIAAGTVPLSVIKEWDMTFLKKEAAKRGGLNWPGIEAQQESALSVWR